LLGALGLFESGEFDQFLKTVRKRFDYVILDAPPVPVFSEFRVLCSKVDGIVLVVKSDETRRQVALRAKKEIEAAQGNLIGVVLNKRKYYIPKWIYKRL
jgi:Mrp family chromosome partitioning ATPase